MCERILVCVCCGIRGRMVIVVVTLAFVSHGQQSVSQQVLAPTYMPCIL